MVWYGVAIDFATPTHPFSVPFHPPPPHVRIFPLLAAVFILKRWMFSCRQLEFALEVCGCISSSEYICELQIDLPVC